MLLAADAGFDDFVQQGKSSAKEVRAFDRVVSLDDLSGALYVCLGLSLLYPPFFRAESQDLGVCFRRRQQFDDGMNPPINFCFVGFFSHDFASCLQDKDLSKLRSFDGY